MTAHRDLDADAVLEAVRAITEAVAACLEAGRTSLCELDGCLLVADEPCPACDVRAKPPRCECGARLRAAGAEVCWRCLRKRPRPLCGCGRQIRTDAAQCSRCRRKSSTTRETDESPRPVGWVRRGLIWRPVYEQSEVA